MYVTSVSAYNIHTYVSIHIYSHMFVLWLDILTCSHYPRWLLERPERGGERERNDDDVLQNINYFQRLKPICLDFTSTVEV